jgi:hypothetical protein
VAGAQWNEQCGERVPYKNNKDAKTAFFKNKFFLQKKPAMNVLS